MSMTSEIVTRLSEQLDRELLSLLQTRFKPARVLGVAKKASGLPVFDREREQSTLEKVRAVGSDSSEASNLVAVFRRILEESRAIELKAAAAGDRLNRVR
jgi:chorismate mutase